MLEALLHNVSLTLVWVLLTRNIKSFNSSVTRKSITHYNHVSVCWFVEYVYTLDMGVYWQRQHILMILCNSTTQSIQLYL